MRERKMRETEKKGERERMREKEGEREREISKKHCKKSLAKK